MFASSVETFLSGAFSGLVQRLETGGKNPTMRNGKEDKIWDTASFFYYFIFFQIKITIPGN